MTYFNFQFIKKFVIFTEGELNLNFLYEILMIPAIERGRGTGTDVLERRRTPRRKISDGDVDNSDDDAVMMVS